VATKISQKFNVQCKSKYVKNHFKTMIKEWGIITKFTNKSSFGSLQDFTVLPTEKFCRCVNRSSSVIFLPMSSPTDVGFPFVGDSPFHRYIGRQNKKIICR
jgi:phosphatidylserine decarboxylase